MKGLDPACFYGGARGMPPHLDDDDELRPPQSEIFCHTARQTSAQAAVLEQHWCGPRSMPCTTKEESL